MAGILSSARTFPAKCAVTWPRVDNLLLLPPPPARFTPSQWNANNIQRFRTADDQHNLATRIINEGARVRDSTEERTNAKLDETNHRIDEKLLDLEYRRSELNKQRKAIVDELDDNQTYMDRMYDCMDHLRKGPLDQNRKCITIREGRLGIDLTHDRVECELRKEREVLEGSLAMLERMMEQLKEESRELRAQRYLLDRELFALEESIKIDEYNRQLRHTDLNLSVYEGSRSLDNAEYSVAELVKHEELSLQKCAKRVHNARLLRAYIDKLMRQIYEDCKALKDAVDEALLTHIANVKAVKKKLEDRHAETMRLANEQTREITALDKALQEKEGYMALAHTRLGNRAQRLDQELCKDAVQSALLDETSKICQGVHELQAQRIESQASLRYLLKTQIQLEEDINVKTNSLKIDEVECMSIRRSMTHRPY